MEYICTLIHCIVSNLDAMKYVKKHFVEYTGDDDEITRLMKEYELPVPTKDNMVDSADIYLLQSTIRALKDGSEYFIICANSVKNPKGHRLWMVEIKNPNARTIKAFKRHLEWTYRESKNLNSEQATLMLKVIESINGYIRSKYPILFLASVELVSN